MSKETPSSPRLEKAVAELRQAAPPAELRQRIADAVFTERSAPQPRPVWLRPGLSLAAVAASAGLLALFWQTPTRTPPDNGVAPIPGVAFARVEEAMLQTINSVSWTETTTTYTPEGKNKGSSSSEIWAGIKEATLCRRTNLSQEDGGGVALSLQKPHLQVGHAPRPGYWLALQDVPKGKEHGLKTYLQKEVFFSRDAEWPSAPYLKNKQMIVKTSPWKVAHVTLEEKPAVRFRRTVSMTRQSDVYRTEFTIYADPNNYRIVQREFRSVYPNTEQVKYLCIASNYRYNQPPPFAVRDLTPPPGTRVSVSDRRQTSLVANISPQTRAEIRSLLKQAGSSWSARDWKRFDALWDWDYFDRTLPWESRTTYMRNYTTRGYIRELFQQRGQSTPWQLDRIVSVQHPPRYQYRRSANEPFPPVKRPDVYQVQTLLGARTAEPPQVTFLVVRNGNSLRIAQASFGGFMHLSPRSRSSVTRRPTPHP